MDNKTSKKLLQILPGPFKNVWRTYLKGRISAYAQNDSLLYDTGILKQLHVDSYSQYGQDAFIYWMIFGGKKTEGGLFLDIGGNDPININNTYFFEQKGWTGLAFEPIKAQADKWEGVRKTPCYNVAIGMTEDEVEFTEEDAHQHSGIGITSEGEGSVKYKVRQRKLSNILKENGIKHVDVVSLDVEGYEMNVLKGIDFNEVDITCFCIENNEDGNLLPDLNLRKFMIEKGYRLIARLSIDDIFVKNDYFKATT